MGIAYTIAKLITQEGIGAFNSQSESDWSVNIGIEPKKPNKTITVYDTGGDGPDTDEMDVDRKTAQIRVRGHLRPEAMAKMQEIRSFLLSRVTREFESVRLFGVVITTDIAEIGRDDNNRAILTLNIRTLSNGV